VSQSWLQNGYKKFEDAVEALKCVDYLDKKRIESALYYHKSKSDARVGITDMSWGNVIYPEKGKIT